MADTPASTSGATTSLSCPDAQRQLDNPWASMSFALLGIWTAMADTISSTTGAVSLSFALAHMQLDKSNAFMPFTLAGTDLTNAARSWVGVPNCSDKCSRLLRTFAVCRGPSWPSSAISSTRACSRRSTWSSQSLCRKAPFFLKASSRLYAADAWIESKIGPSTISSKTLPSLRAEVAFVI